MSRYSDEIKDFIAQHVQGTTIKDLVKIVNAEFGPLFTEAKMQAYKKNHGLKSGTPSGLPAGRPTELFPEEIQTFVRLNHVGVGLKDMAVLLNKTFGKSYTRPQLKTYYDSRDISSGFNSRFRPGHIPPNKGRKGYHSPGSEKGWFGKDHIPLNHKPVGSERLDDDRYVLIKTAEPNVWQPKHKVIWEAKNGKVPKGHVLTFLDGDKSNITIENLTLITQAEHMEITRSRLRSSNPEFTKTAILIAKVKIARYNKKAVRNASTSRPAEEKIDN